MSEGENAFGSLLTELRGKAGLSQSELADKVLVSASTISHLEMGRRLPSIEVAIRLAKELDISLDLLLAEVPA